MSKTRPAEPQPSQKELDDSLPDLFAAAGQCAAWHFWARAASSTTANGSPSPVAILMKNAILEATLLFVRKSAEFFKPKEPNDKPDTNYSYRYAGYLAQEWIIPEEAYLELHKRVGHITIRRARYGVVEWPMFPMAMQAMNKWVEFFEFLAKSRSGRDSARCSEYARNLRVVISRIREANSEARP